MLGAKKLYSRLILNITIFCSSYVINILVSSFFVVDISEMIFFTGQDISYLHSLQAQSFPHISKTQLQLSESPTPQQAKMDIYENPSEHYASINNYGVGIQHPRTGGEGKKEYENEIKKIQK